MRDKFAGLALGACLAYAVVALAWIFFPRSLPAAWVGDAGTLTKVSLGFVAVTTGLFYVVTRRQVRRQEAEIVRRQEAERSLQKTNRALHMISSCNQILIRATEETELLKNICRLVVEEGGYAFSWVGYAVDSEARSVRSMARFGRGAEPLDHLQLTWADMPRDHGPVGMTIRTGRVGIFRNPQDGHELAVWEEGMRQNGCQAAISLPLTAGGSTFGALSIYATGADAFVPAEAGLLAEMADDLAFGIAGLRSRAEHRRVVQELRESEERLRLAQAAAKTGIFDVDLLCDFATWTAEEEAIFGFAPGTYDHTADTFWNLLHPEDRERIRELVDQAIANLTEFNAEYRFYRNGDNQLRWALVRGKAVYDQDGQPVRLLGVNIDITDFKDTEEMNLRLATAVEQAVEDIIITDAASRILYVNPAFEKTTGYTRAEVLNQNPRLLKSDKHDADFYKEMWARLTGGLVWSGHLINRKKDGTLFEEEVTISPIRNTTGNITNYVAVRRDVTHEMALEDQLRRAQKMEAIGTLAGGIAHDFNNVLAAILGSAELIKMDVAAGHPAREYLDQIFQAGHRARDVVQQILTFSQRRETERSVVHLQPVVKECVKLLRSTIPTMVDISWRIDLNCPPVLADPTQIHQVIMNLCTNAWQALPQNDGRIRVNLEMCEPTTAVLAAHPELGTGSLVRLSICDNGTGMDKATMERIFEPFFTTKPVGRGSGLGLAVVHGIVKSHQGAITVESEPGKGSAFHIYLPPQTREEIEVPAPAETLFKGNQERILFVDDDEFAGRAMEMVLSRIGYQISWFQHPQEALQDFYSHPADYDLAITDLAMPGLNGENLAAALLVIRPDLPILITTGLIDSAILKQARKMGVGNVLLKPVNFNALAQEIAQRLRKRDAVANGAKA